MTASGLLIKWYALMTCYSFLNRAKMIIFNVEDKIKLQYRWLGSKFDSFLALADFVHLLEKEINNIVVDTLTENVYVLYNNRIEEIPSKSKCN